MKKLLTTMCYGCALLAVLCTSAKEEDQAEQAEQAEQVDQVEAVVIRGQVDAQLVEELTRARASLDDAARKLIKLERELEASKKEVVLHDILPSQDGFSVQISGPSISMFEENSSKGAIGRSIAGSGYLGIWMGDDENGIRIGRVMENGPAHDAGLQKDDVITKVDKLDVSGDLVFPTATMAEYIAFLKPGTKIDLTFVRDGTEMSTTATLSLRPEPLHWDRSQRTHELLDELRSNQQQGNVAVRRDLLRAVDGNFFRRLSDSCGPDGFWIADIEGDLGQYFNVEYGVLVLSTIDGTELKNGDILLSIDDKPVRSVSHARRFIRAAGNDAIEFSVKRKGREKQLSLDADAVKEKSSRCG